MINPLGVQGAVNVPASPDPSLQGIPFASEAVRKSYTRALRVYAELTDGFQLTMNQRAFVAGYRLTGTIAAGAAVAKLSISNHYRWLQESEQYRAAVLQAETEIGDMLEAHAISRAVSGWDEPVYQQGRQVGTVRKYSDRLLERLLEGAKPAKYAKRSRIETTDAPEDDLATIDQAIKEARAKAAEMEAKLAAMGDEL